MMQWSKIRARLVELLVPDLRSRIGFHLTNYREHSGHAHELWITVDKQRVFSASYCNNMIEENVLQRRTGMRVWGDDREAKLATDILTKREVHDPADIVSSFRTYLDLDPQIAITSSDVVLRALAVVDRRIGKKTLRALDIGKNEHSLVRAFYSLRMKS